MKSGYWIIQRYDEDGYLSSKIRGNGLAVDQCVDQWGQTELIFAFSIYFMDFNQIAPNADYNKSV